MLSVFFITHAYAVRVHLYFTSYWVMALKYVIVVLCHECRQSYCKERYIYIYIYIERERDNVQNDKY